MKRLLLAGAVLFAAAAVTAVVVRGGLTTSSAKAASPGDGLSAYVVFSNRGPIPPCDPNSCSDAANFTWIYAHIVNTNPIVNSTTAGSPRSGATNAFVLESVDETILINGTVFSQETLTRRRM
jgi:hypothetical protein